MCFGGGGGSQTVTNQTKLPQWVDDAAQQNLKDATSVANNLAKPYTGNLVAGFSQDTEQAMGLTRANQGVWRPAMQAGQQAVQGAAGYQPQQIGAGSFLNGNVQAYMSPYLDSVEKNGLRAIDEQRQRSLNGVADGAIGAGAFGGSRHGVMEGVTNAEAAKVAGDFSANVRNQGFTQAAGLMTADMDRRLAADNANQAAGLQGAQLRMGAGQALGAMGLQQAQQGYQDASVLEAIGSKQEDLQSRLLAQDYQRYQDARQYPLEQLSIKANALGMTPYGGTTTQTSPTQRSNPALGALGGAAAGASIASTLGATGGTAGWLSGGGALLGLLGLSDETMKEDVEKVGKDPETGLNVVAFRYKGDPKSYPKVVGVMAQDVKKKHPSQVKKVGGKLAINMDVSHRAVRNLGFGG
jgi:hypothetical protein